MGQWLVRTAQNWIRGPYSKDQICQMILGGQISLQDEICAANSYWIYVHERAEVRSQLGIEPPREEISSDDETTETHVLKSTQSTQTMERAESPRSPAPFPSPLHPEEQKGGRSVLAAFLHHFKKRL